MPCVLTIELDSTTPFRHGGEEVTGKVHVRARERLRCRDLTVALTTTLEDGRGQESVTVERASLFRGRLRPGDERRFDFRFPLPPQPWSHQGERVTLGWRLEARASLAGAPDVHATQPLFVKPPPRPWIVVAPVDNRGPEHRWGRGCLGASLALLLLALVVFFVVRDARGLLAGLTAAEILAIVGLAGLFVSVPRVLAERKLGGVEVSVEHKRGEGYRQAGPSGELSCAVRLGAAADVGEVTATLRVVEQGRTKPGAEAGVLRDVLYERRVALRRDPARSADEALVYVGQLPLPPPGTVPLPWRGTKTEAIRWELHTHVAVPGWPDYDETLALDARCSGPS